MGAGGRWRGRGSVGVTAVGALGFVAVAGLQVRSVAQQLGQPGAPFTDHSLVDFRDTVWQPVRDLAAGHDPYDVTGYLARHPGSQELDLYSPGSLVLHAPLALLPYTAAAVVWVALLLAGLVAAGWLCLRAAGVARPRLGMSAGVAALLLLTVGGHNLLLSGQLGLEVVVGVWLATGLATGRAIGRAGRGAGLLAGDGWPAAAGLALALTKPQTGLPLLVVLLALGARRTVVRGVALAAALAAPAVAVLLAIEGGPAGLLRVVRANASYSTQDSSLALRGATGGIRVDLVGAVNRATDDQLSGAVQLVVTVLLLALAVAAARSLWPGPLPLPPGASMLIALALLLALVHSVYDQLLLAAPLAALLGTLVRERSADAGERSLAPVPAGLAALLTAGVLVHAHSTADHLVHLRDGPSELLDVSTLIVAGGLLVIARRQALHRAPPHRSPPPAVPSAARPA